MPLVLLVGCIATLVACVFPVPAAMLGGIGGLLSAPVVWLLRRTGKPVGYFLAAQIKPASNWHMLGAYAVMLTIALWVPLAICRNYYHTGKLTFGN